MDRGFGTAGHDSGPGIRVYDWGFQCGWGKILQNPWGIVSLVDLYTGFILFSAWIIYREKSILLGALWVVLMMVLGFFTASLYVLITLYQSKGNWKLFWMGKHASG